MTDTCSVEDCDKPIYQKRDRLCRKHYIHSRQKGVHPSTLVQGHGGTIKTFASRRGADATCVCGWHVSALTKAAAQSQLDWHVANAKPIKPKKAEAT